MSSRARALLFALGALCCAGLSAALAGGLAEPAGEGLEDLRPVVVTRTALAKGEAIDREGLDSALEERRVPAVFAPPDALALASEALGRRLATTLPPGSYLTVAHLTSGQDGGSRRTGPPKGTTPVDIAVTGAGALAATRAGPGARVDIVVSGAPGPGPATGRTYVAASRVPLLDLVKARAQAGLAGDRWTATLALSREQALRLIRAEGAAGSIRLLAR